MYVIDPSTLGLDCLLQLHDDDDDRSRVLSDARGCHVTREKATEGGMLSCSALHSLHNHIIRHLLQCFPSPFLHHHGLLIAQTSHPQWIGEGCTHPKWGTL